MAKAVSKPNLSINCTFTINEEECRALDALAGYGTEEFIKSFYEKLGMYYMRDHESGLREFLDTVLTVVGPAIRQVDEARSLLKSSYH